MAWNKFCQIHAKDGNAAALAYARRAFAAGSADRIAAERALAPTATDRRAAADRRAALDAYSPTRAEIAAHCRFAGLPRIGR